MANAHEHLLLHHGHYHLPVYNESRKYRNKQTWRDTLPFIGPHQSSKLSPETSVLQVHFFQTQSEMLSEKDIGIYFP